MKYEYLDKTEKIDLPKLRRSYPALYRESKNYLGPDGSVHLKGLPADIKEKLEGWLVINYAPQQSQRTHGFGVQSQQQPSPQPQQPPQPAPPQQPDLEQPVRSHAGSLDEWIRSRSKARSVPQPARPVAPAPVVTASLPPPVRRLSNGEPELALDASVVEMRAASKIQLQDLSRRRGEGRQQHLGRFAGRF